MILMARAKDWIDKRTDGVVAKAFNLSYCIRIGMCNKTSLGLQQKCTNARSELNMVEITPPSRMDVLRPPFFTCMHTCVSCMHVNTFMNRALRIAAWVPRAMPCRNIAPHFVCEAVSYDIAVAAMCSGPCTTHVNVSSPS